MADEDESWHKVFRTPEGYALGWRQPLPWKYRIWMNTPILREYAPEHLMTRGLAWLEPSPELDPSELGEVDPRWVVKEWDQSTTRTFPLFDVRRPLSARDAEQQLDLRRLRDRLHAHDLSSAEGVADVVVREGEIGIVLDVWMVDRHRFGTDHVRWHGPLVVGEGAPPEGYEDWESFAAEEIVTDFLDGFADGAFHTIDRDDDGVPIVGEPADP